MRTAALTTFTLTQESAASVLEDDELAAWLAAAGGRVDLPACGQSDRRSVPANDGAGTLRCEPLQCAHELA